MVKEYHILDECLLLCTCAESTLSDMCDRISEGSVTSNELSLIEKKKNHVLKLIGAATKDKDVAKHLEEALEIRLREHKRFCEEKERLVQLCNRVPIKIQGILYMYMHGNNEYSGTSHHQGRNFLPL